MVIQDSKFKVIENKEIWQDLLNKALFKTFFHSLAWEEFLEKQFKWLKFERYLYKDEALLSLARCKVSGKEKLVSHPFCEYGGPLPLKENIDFPSFQKALLSEFQIDFSIKLHPKLITYFSNMNLPLPPSPVAGDSLYYGARRNSYLIEDLGKKTKEELWTSLRKTLRPVIEKSQGAGLEVREAKSRQELKKFYNLYIRTCKRNRTLAYPYSFFSYFLERPTAEIVLAKEQGRVIAGSVFLLHKGFVHYFINASDRSYKALYPNHLILWLQIVKYLGREYKFFDLGGTRDGSLLEVFKSGWGAKKYPILELGNLPPSEGLQKSKMRGLWGFLPLWAIKTLSPYLLRYKL